MCWTPRCTHANYAQIESTLAIFIWTFCFFFVFAFSTHAHQLLNGLRCIDRKTKIIFLLCKLLLLFYCPNILKSSRAAQQPICRDFFRSFARVAPRDLLRTQKQKKNNNNNLMNLFFWSVHRSSYRRHYLLSYHICISLQSRRWKKSLQKEIPEKKTRKQIMLSSSLWCIWDA